VAEPLPPILAPRAGGAEAAAVRSAFEELARVRMVAPRRARANDAAVLRAERTTPARRRVLVSEKGDGLRHLDCFECGAAVEAEDLADLGERFLDHARTSHEWPYPDQGIRNYAEATQRLTGPADRLPELGEVAIHPVSERLDDWAACFDHDAFVGNPEWAGCYCLEPHVAAEGANEEPAVPHRRDNREAMLQRLRDGRASGYLASVDGRPAGSTPPCAPTTPCTRPRMKIRLGPR
jgi:hypothetical protein